MKTVYGITPNTSTGKFEVLEVQMEDRDYYRQKPTGAIFDTREEAEKKMKQFIKTYNNRK